MKATFFDRLAAYFIDTIVITFITLIISFGLPEITGPAHKKVAELDKQFQSQEIMPIDYLEEYMNTPLQYNYQKEALVPTIISVSVIIAYFVIFQYMNKGQTIGKKLMHIKVVDEKTKKPISIGLGFLRSLLILNILSSILSILYLYILNKNNYFLVYIVTVGIENLFILISGAFILYRKDKHGIHDIITNTEVIKERG